MIARATSIFPSAGSDPLRSAFADRARVAAAEAVGAEHDVVRRHEGADLVGMSADVVGGGDGNKGVRLTALFPLFVLFDITTAEYAHSSPRTAPRRKE